ncbi:S4 domain-containing protein YaaA [Streptococcus sp. sy018]|uniref:S4 domain-containing protein YaaA n=1 Tax=Streptococcus sp. sy018 TaxID=2600147 RepID=UPI0011B80BBA|nr:S4 domain-containing protein YaaA [Streptococcus sp. sy018]TWS94674.1 S4 domain-containing protein YaaA [Streptococcus sp. sy018]
MNYKLFSDYITLQALLKEQGIIQTGGAIKAFLAEHTVLFNGEDEKRRGKKIRLGDIIDLPQQNIKIIMVEPSQSEKEQYKAEQEEKKRVAELVKNLNKNQTQKISKPVKKTSRNKKKPVRFPGT